MFLRSFNFRSASLALALTIGGSATVVASGCGRAKLATDMPGPNGCGLRDPRETSPGMLSMAQKQYFQKRRAVKDVKRNEHGGLDWIYNVSAGSVFGEQQRVETISFDAQGLLVNTNVELLRRVGK